MKQADLGAGRCGTQRRTAGETLSVLCVLWVLVATPASVEARPARMIRTSTTPSSHPDRVLYQEAQSAAAALKASPRRQAQRAEWEKLVLRYRKIVARYPQSAYCDNALLAIGDLYREMARRFAAARYEDDAAFAYRTLVKEYPSSGLGEQALYSVVEISRASKDRRREAEAVRAYLDTFPDSKRAPELKRVLRRSAPAQAAALPSPPPPGLARVFNLRFWSGDSSTRVVIDVEREVPTRNDRISHPDRLWVDLQGTRLHPNLKDRTFPVGDGLLEQVRVGQNKDDVVRIVLDFKEVKDHTVFYLQDPPRLVIDVRGAARPAMASAERAPVAEGASPAPTPSPATVAALPADDKIDRLPTRRVDALTAPEPRAAAPRTSPPPVVVDGTRRGAPSKGAPAPEETPAPAPPATASRSVKPEAPSAPQPPQVNRAGSYSLARQLGLGARKIVIDAGHGGHDPGTIGRAGLQEKDLVLDVALRLEKLVRSELGADVVMTRSSDVFIPLEERTAIANSKGADLFLSVHANSSRSAQARGIETYFLNFAVDPHAEEVAARENSISAATMKDLQGLVKAIALNSKIDESRDFASSVQEAMVGSLRPIYAGALDRGVHTAPFYVLIGANMPSVLAEIAFVSHPEEEKLLKSPEYRDRIARSLLAGVRGYLEGLSKTPLPQLTGGGRASTVATRGRRR
jgi:N-acetylmuramoyl-L-alanine amidase